MVMDVKSFSTVPTNIHVQVRQKMRFIIRIDEPSSGAEVRVKYGGKAQLSMELDTVEAAELCDQLEQALEYATHDKEVRV